MFFYKTFVCVYIFLTMTSSKTRKRVVLYVSQTHVVKSYKHFNPVYV